MFPYIRWYNRSLPLPPLPAPYPTPNFSALHYLVPRHNLSQAVSGALGHCAAADVKSLDLALKLLQHPDVDAAWDRLQRRRHPTPENEGSDDHLICILTDESIDEREKE